MPNSLWQLASAGTTLTVRAGDTVVWTNKDPYPHTVTAAAKAFDSGTLQPESSWKLTPTQAGTLPCTCTLHLTMKGTLAGRVGGRSASAGGAPWAWTLTNP